MSSDGMPSQESRELRAAQHERLDRRRSDQDRTLVAIQQLEAALASAAPGREGPWRDEVRGALAVLGEVTTREAENAATPDSLLSDVARTQPWLRNRVRGLRIQYRQIQAELASLQSEIDAADSPVDFADTRQRLAWVLAGLRHQRARESDLIYEAYYDAFRTDLPREGEKELRG
ncbi:MAG: hypothetical protein ACYDGN_12045 [Acidimicrobiales bacterium]